MSVDPNGFIMDIDAEGLPWIHFNNYDMPQPSGGDAEWLEVPVPRRSEPHQTYVQTSAQLWTITGKIVASQTIGDGRKGADVERDVAFLRSLNYPDYGLQGVEYFRQPHRAKVLLGGVLNATGIIKGLTINYAQAFDAAKKPLVAEVSFNLIIISNDPPSFRDVRFASGETWGEDEVIG